MYNCVIPWFYGFYEFCWFHGHSGKCMIVWHAFFCFCGFGWLVGLRVLVWFRDSVDSEIWFYGCSFFLRTPWPCGFLGFSGFHWFCEFWGAWVIAWHDVFGSPGSADPETNKRWCDPVDSWILWVFVDAGWLARGGWLGLADWLGLAGAGSRIPYVWYAWYVCIKASGVGSRIPSVWYVWYAWRRFKGIWWARTLAYHIIAELQVNLSAPTRFLYTFTRHVLKLIKTQNEKTVLERIAAEIKITKSDPERI